MVARVPLAPDRATAIVPARAAPRAETPLGDPLGEPLIDAAAVAVYLSVDTSTVYRLAQTGAIPAIKIAHRVLRFRATDVRAFLEDRTRKAALPGRVKYLLGSSRE